MMRMMNYSFGGAIDWLVRCHRSWTVRYIGVEVAWRSGVCEKSFFYFLGVMGKGYSFVCK